jgi:DNA polymerase III subunit epsilon
VQSGFRNGKGQPRGTERLEKFLKEGGKMIVVGLDLEATGLDKVKDRPIEVGLTLWSTNMQRGLETHNFLIQADGVPVTAEITEITGATQKSVDTFGHPLDEAFDDIVDFVNRGEAIVAFNGPGYDIPMMKAWAKRLGKTFPDKLVIDPYTDMPLYKDTASPGMRGQELITMCAKNKIYYDAHEAGADVGAMLRLMSIRDFNLVLQRAKSDVVIVQSKQHRSENAKAKKHKFRWNPDHTIWWKAVKRIDLDNLVAQVNNEFGLVERADLTLEQLDTND